MHLSGAASPAGERNLALAIAESIDQRPRRQRFGRVSQDRYEEIDVIVGQPN